MSTSGFDDPEARAAWLGVSAAFAALGRAFLCVDAQLNVLHASVIIEDILGSGAAEAAEGRTLEELFGPELFGSAGALTVALAAGERREGWRAHLRIGGSNHYTVSLSTAPFPKHLFSSCDPRVAHVVVIKPVEHDREGGLAAPTVISGLVARSAAMLKLFDLVETMRHSEATVLISGESGTGKEVIARAIHEHSSRRDGPFVAVNCGALPADLLESEMFGHVRGAFTGAVRDRAGRFEFATNGTLFLDEIGDLPLPLQVKLLRVLQDGTFERVGESTTRASRARIIAATNVDLRDAIRAGRFRDDLYYRLRVVPIEIPPLRERREDIEPLTLALLSRVGARHGRALQLSPDAMRVLLAYDWPGNGRELENVLEYAVTVCRGQTILPEDLPELAGLHRPSTTTAPAIPSSSAGDVEELRRVLDRHHWNRESAAKALGISRSTLWRRLREAGIA